MYQKIEASSFVSDQRISGIKKNNKKKASSRDSATKKLYDVLEALEPHIIRIPEKDTPSRQKGLRRMHTREAQGGGLATSNHISTTTVLCFTSQKLRETFFYQGYQGFPHNKLKLIYSDSLPREFVEESKQISFLGNGKKGHAMVQVTGIQHSLDKSSAAWLP